MQSSGPHFIDKLILQHSSDDKPFLVYAARACFSRDYGEGWDNYIEGINLLQVSEITSLDYLLNEDVVVTDNSNETDWDHYLQSQGYLIPFYTTMEYVLRRSSDSTVFNLLAVSIEPARDVSSNEVDGFEFVGYELLDKEYCNSALTNCGPHDEDGFPGSALNEVGLIDDYHNARSVQKELLVRDPKEPHFQTNLIAVWRHKTIGRVRRNVL